MCCGFYSCCCVPCLTAVFQRRRPKPSSSPPIDTQMEVQKRGEPRSSTVVPVEKNFQGETKLDSQKPRVRARARGVGTGRFPASAVW